MKPWERPKVARPTGENRRLDRRIFTLRPIRFLFVTENTFLPSLVSILHVGATRNTKTPNCMTDIRQKRLELTGRGVNLKVCFPNRFTINRAWSKPKGLLPKPVYN